jgi:ribosomal protein L37AE/L43A
MNAAKPQCPHCEAMELRRHARSGFWQKQVLSRLGYFPWECGQCRQIFMCKLRSTGYRQTTGQPARATLINRLLLKDHS